MDVNDGNIHVKSLLLSRFFNSMVLTIEAAIALERS